MKLHYVYLPFAAVALLGLSGCVTVPTGPSVMALPSPQKPFDVFRAEDMDCRNYALYSIGGTEGQQAAQNSAASSAIAGTLIGAAAGAAIGAATGQAGAGAAIGAGSGLLVGSAAGSNAYGASSYTMQRRYDNAYVQCMYAKGNQVPVPGSVQRAYGNGYGGGYNGGYAGGYNGNSAPPPSNYAAPPPSSYSAPPSTTPYSEPSAPQPRGY